MRCLKPTSKLAGAADSLGWGLSRLGVALLLGTLPLAAEAQSPIRLRDLTPQSGIRFQHTDGSSGRRYIVETVSAGLATFDYDGDGRIDIYFVNGAPLPGAKVDLPPKNVLYRNLGDWRFTDVTDQAGVGDTGFGLGACVGDFDNDGHPDLYVSNFGPNVLYRNNGDGTFSDVTGKAGVGRGNKVGAGCCFLDIDGDGRLDLYAANYVRFTFEVHKPLTVGGVPAYRGPREYPPEPDTLFRNNGDGTFTEVSRESGIALSAGTGMGMVCADYDNDGDTDILVLNDVAGNFLFRNDGRGRFEEVGVQSGFAYNLYGQATGSMGIDCGDLDNDGWLDFFMTCYQNEHPILYRNLGGGLLEDATLLAGAAQGGIPYVNWGCGLVDFDNDGYKDIFFVNGHLQDNVDLFDDTTSYEAFPVLLWNNGHGRFVDVSSSSGDGLRVKSVGRGAAFEDFDNDGRIDVAILNSRRPARILRNETQTANHWLQIRLMGVKTNRDGVGARVKVVAGQLIQIDEVHSGRGYQGHFGSRLHFGLGKRDRVDRIEVRWLGGGVEILHDLAVDRLLTIIEGAASPEKPAVPTTGG
ncbi:MAG: CRTAC1 family protein [Thermoguttaceae bacterium]